VVELVNAERARVKMQPLEVDPRLEQLAMEYATSYMNDGSCAHACGPVPKLMDRFAQAGLPLFAFGENLAGRFHTPETVMLAWVASPSHRDNILNPVYDSIGIGVVRGSDGLYWAQEFAKAKSPQAAAPVTELDPLEPAMRPLPTETMDEATESELTAADDSGDQVPEVSPTLWSFPG
jgi:hypothetical protein